MVKIRNLVLEQGIMKICVPIIGRTEEEIIQQAEKIISCQADIIEWRVDFFEHVCYTEKIIELAKKLRSILEDTPLLYTFRSKKEGGGKTISIEDYVQMNEKIAQSGYVDCMDVELFTEGLDIKNLVENLQKENIVVILSNHDFEKTPNKEEIINRLVNMKTLGADISKIALMPQSSKDVLTLLEATNEMKEKYSDISVITMSMSPLGSISRVAGNVFGSLLTFASVEGCSAPGQIPIEELREMQRFFSL